MVVLSVFFIIIPFLLLIGLRLLSWVFNLPHPLTFWYPWSYHQNNNPFTLNILQAAEDDGAFCWLSTVFQTFSNFFFASEEDESGMLSLSEDTDDLDDLRGAVSGIVFTTSQFNTIFSSFFFICFLAPCWLYQHLFPLPSVFFLLFFPPLVLLFHGSSGLSFLLTRKRIENAIEIFLFLHENIKFKLYRKNSFLFFKPNANIYHPSIFLKSIHFKQTIACL